MSRIFVSYSREDDAAHFVTEFVKELRDEVRSRTRWPDAESVYHDIAMRPGVRWSTELVDALRGCHVFIALYSPAYFSSENCGREWALFTERLERHRQRHDVFPPSLIPVLWELPTSSFVVPDFAQVLQYADAYTQATGRKRGLRYFARQRKRYEAEYDDAVQFIVDTALEVIERHPLERVDDESWDFATTVNAFAAGRPHTGPSPSPAIAPQAERGEPHAVAAPPDPAPVGAAPVDPAPRSGPGFVHYVVAAAPATAIRPVRDPEEIYGRKPVDWTPYRPEHPDPLVQYASDVSRKERITDSPKGLDGGLQALIKEAKRDNELVVLLVDPWTMTLEQYKRLVDWYDGQLWLHTAVVVAWNESDTAVATRRTELQDNIHDLFRNNRLARANVYSESAGTLDQFQVELRRVLVAAQSLLFSTGDVARSADSAQVIGRPQISGPGGDV